MLNGYSLSDGQFYPKSDIPEWEVSFAGERLTLHHNDGRVWDRRAGKRKTCGEFSPSARFRMLKWIAEINWPKVGPSLFITLTYADEVVHDDKEKRNRERYLFLRSVENYLGHEVSSIWRVEREKRKSGRRKGESWPHLHLFVFGVRWIPSGLLRLWWNQATRSSVDQRVHVRRPEDGKTATKYIAKYCGKAVPSYNLVIVTYLNSHGRSWGCHRKSKIPLHPTERYPLLNPALVYWIRAKAGTKMRYLDLDFAETFTVLGDLAVEIQNEWRKKSLDGGTSLG